MKKTILSLAAASLVASSAMAADKGIEFKTTGQAVVYYNTLGNDSVDMFDKDSKKTKANYAIQINNDADLGNGFGLGSQLSYLGTAGLEKNLVGDVMQSNGTVSDADDKSKAGYASEIYLSKLFITKKVANTTVKMGRQELPKSLSPFAFSEGWNVFKNTFDAVVVINSDIPKTTLVGAYVSKTSGNGFGNDMSTMTDLAGHSDKDKTGLAKTGAYMITALNTSLPMTTLTGSYYQLRGVAGEAVHALWVDAKVAGKSLPMGLKVGIQAGTVDPSAIDTYEATTAFGVKVGAKPMKNLTVCGAFSTVSEGTLAIDNQGTGVKTPLYTQMVGNQDAIKLDNSTLMGKAAYSLGKAGQVIAQASYTSADADNAEFDLIYKRKVSGIDLLTAYVYSETEGEKDGANNIVRVVARYAF